MMESKGNGESSGQKNNALQGRDSGKKGAKMSEVMGLVALLSYPSTPKHDLWLIGPVK